MKCLWWGTTMVKEPNIARLRDNFACHDFVKILYRPSWPWLVNEPLRASKISFIPCVVTHFWVPKKKRKYKNIYIKKYLEEI
jgi:hypothetical protein